jgi:putative ABC transport system permease protein
MKYLVLIVRNMTRRTRRTVLIALTIAAATLVFAMLVAVPASMDRIIANAARGQRLFIVNRAGPYGVPGKYCRDIRPMPNVTGCAAEWDYWMLYRSQSDWIGTTAADLELLDLSPELPNRPDEVAQFRREKRSAAVGSELMKRNHWRVGQQIMLHTFGGQDVQFIIAAELPSQLYPNAFLMRGDYLEDTLKARGGGLGYAARLVVRIDTADNVGAVARAIDEKYRNAEAETRSQTEADALANGLAHIGNIRAIIVSLVAVVLMTVMLIAGNSMAMTVRDRIPEVALLRTLGFGGGRISCLLFGEAALLGLAGGAIGAAGALALFAGGIDLGTITSGLGLISVTPAVAVESLVVAIAVSILSGTAPILGALQTPPAIALRKVV